MGNYSAAMLAAARQNASPLYALVDLTLSSGVKRWSSGPLRVPGVGTYTGRLLKMGSVYRSKGDITGGLIYPKMDDVVVEDADGTLGRELELTKPDGAAISARMACRGVAEADWLPLFGNGVLDDWRMDEPHRWTLISSFNELPLRSPFPRTLIPREDFPFAADPKTYTYSAFVAYGIHNSANAGDRGMIPLHYVNVQTGDFGVWLGWITIQRVFKDDVLVDPADYTVVHEVINGRLWTYVRLDTPPDPVDNPKVTADIEGYHDGTDGAGALLTGADALAHLLTHWVFATEEWKSGAWFSASSLISVPHFDEMQTFLELLSWQKVSRQYGGENRISGADAVQEFCQSLAAIGGCRPFFTASGKLGVRPNYFTATTLSYTGLRRLRYEIDTLNVDSFKLFRSRTHLADLINVRSILNTVDGNYTWALQVRDISVQRNRGMDLDLPWSHAQIE